MSNDDFDKLEELADDPNTEVDFTNIFTFGSVIQMPVDAVVQANINASIASFDFVKTFGFYPGNDPNDPNKLGKPRMLTFYYIYNNGGVEQKMVVNIPVLSLVTIPLLNVNRAKFDIGINVLNHLRVIDSEVDDTINETLVLLGPVENRGMDNISDHGSVSYSTEVTTNMQATIEVESSDLPAGILQMINLFQDATTGKGKDLYTLDVNKTAIYFSKDNSEVTVETVLSRNNKPIEGELITASVVSETDPNLDSTFKKPILITAGNIVGIPSLGEAQALSNKNGKVKFTFTSVNDVLGNEENGFINFATVKAAKVAVYYNLT